jgi:ketosteroid isomerase-like protein
MSRHNVDVVRQLLPAPDSDIARLFRDETEAVASTKELGPLFHADFQAVAHHPGTTQTYRGLGGLRELWLDWLGPWVSYRATVEEIIDVEDQVVVLARDRGRRSDSDVEVQMLGANVWTFRDGKIARADFYPVREEGLKAVGLRD